MAWLALLACIHFQPMWPHLYMYILPWQTLRFVLECELSALAQMLATRFLAQHDHDMWKSEASESRLPTNQGPYERKVTSRVFLLDKKRDPPWYRLFMLFTCVSNIEKSGLELLSACRSLLFG